MWVRRSSKQTGFTIVELVVAISIIAVLAIISVVGYGAWQSSIRKTQVKNELTAAASAMESARSTNNGYPSSLPPAYEPSGEVTVTLFSVSTDKFCLDGVSNNDSNIKFYIDSKSQSQGAVEGDCTMRGEATVPGQATISGITVTSATSATVTWGAVAGDVTGYTIACATDPAFIVNTVTATAAGNETSKVVTGLVEVAQYYCRVRAENAVGNGQWSDRSTVSMVYIAIVPPTGLSASVPSTGSVLMHWNAVTIPIAATSYDLRYSSSSDMASPSNITGIAATNYTVSLVNGATYYFQVRSVASVGASAWSGVVNVTVVCGFAQTTTPPVSLATFANEKHDTVDLGEGAGQQHRVRTIVMCG